MKSAIKQTSMVQYTQDILLTQNDARTKVQIQEAIFSYHFVNDCGFPAATVEKPQFCNLLTCFMNNSSLIKPIHLLLSNEALMKMQLSSFNEFDNVLHSSETTYDLIIIYSMVELFHLLQSAMTYGRG